MNGVVMRSSSNALTQWWSAMRRRMRPAMTRSAAAEVAAEVGRWIADVTEQSPEVTDVRHLDGTATYVLCMAGRQAVITAWGLGAWSAIRDRAPLAHELLEHLGDPTGSECDLMISARAEEEWAVGTD